MAVLSLALSLLLSMFTEQSERWHVPSPPVALFFQDLGRQKGRKRFHNLDSALSTHIHTTTRKKNKNPGNLEMPGNYRNCMGIQHVFQSRKQQIVNCVESGTAVIVAHGVKANPTSTIPLLQRRFVGLGSISKPFIIFDQRLQQDEDTHQGHPTVIPLLTLCLLL